MCVLSLAVHPKRSEPLAPIYIALRFSGFCRGASSLRERPSKRPYAGGTWLDIQAIQRYLTCDRLASRLR
jgi:hypothetical protein